MIKINEVNNSNKMMKESNLKINIKQLDEPIMVPLIRQIFLLHSAGGSEVVIVKWTYLYSYPPPPPTPSL